MTKKKKQLRINSIREPNLKRILRPCEARAGHGFIAVIIGMSAIGLVIALVVPYVVQFYKWFVSWLTQ